MGTIWLSISPNAECFKLATLSFKVKIDPAQFVFIETYLCRGSSLFSVGTAPAVETGTEIICRNKNLGSRGPALIMRAINLAARIKVRVSAWETIC